MGDLLAEAQLHLRKFHADSAAWLGEGDIEAATKGPWVEGDVAVGLSASRRVDAVCAHAGDLWHLPDDLEADCIGLVRRFRDAEGNPPLHAVAWGCVGSWVLMVLVGKPGAPVDIPSLVAVVRGHLH
jgi:hypothetical protein